MELHSSESKRYYYITSVISHMKIDNKPSIIKGKRIGFTCSVCNSWEITNDKINGIKVVSDDWNGEIFSRYMNLAQLFS